MKDDTPVNGLFDLPKGTIISSILESDIAVKPTSRNKTFTFTPNIINWNSETVPGLIYLTLSNFKVIITEETLSVGNIYTHIKLQFDVVSRWHTSDAPVAIKAYRHANNFLYDVKMSYLNIHCRPQDRYSYDSGLVLLENNHYDIMARFSTALRKRMNS